MNKRTEQDIMEILNDGNIPWQDLDQKTILITGATGLIGSLLVKTLEKFIRNTDNKLKIYILIRNLSKAEALFGKELQENHIIPIVTDIKTPINISEKIDYIIHGASVTTSKYMVTNPVETLLTAILGTENILSLAHHHHVKSMLYLSSMEAYGQIPISSSHITEDMLGYLDLISPRSSYPEGKRVCECLCASYFSEYFVPVKIARLSQTFGAGVSRDDKRVFMHFADSVINNKDTVLHTPGKSVSNFCYISDTIRGILTILTKGKSGQIYNVTNDSEARTISEIATLVAERVAAQRIHVTYDIPKNKNLYGFAPDTTIRLSADKLKNLGWNTHVCMEDAYRRLIEYLESDSF